MARKTWSGGRPGTRVSCSKAVHEQPRTGSGLGHAIHFGKIRRRRYCIFQLGCRDARRRSLRWIDRRLYGTPRFDAEPVLNFPIEAVQRWARGEIKFANENVENLRSD